jgi:3' exoribonuclease, RNase T-like
MTKAAFVMIDLETLSLDIETAPIVSVGAYLFGIIETSINSANHQKSFFEQYETDLPTTFYEVCNYAEQCKYGGKFVSDDTMSWWNSLGSDAISVIQESENTMNMLPDTLNSFNRFIDNIKTQCDDVYVFGNGAAFDNALMEINFRQYGIPIPWKYRNSLCIRTMYATIYNRYNLVSRLVQIEEQAKDFVKQLLDVEFLAHNALHDAIFQSKKAMLMLPEHTWLNIVHNTNKK